MGLRTDWSNLSAQLCSLPAPAKRIALFCFLAFLLTAQAQTGSFSITTQQLSTARYYHTATLLSDGQVLIAGGYQPGANVLSSAELYDPSFGTFTATSGNLSDARITHTSTLLGDGTVLIAGGIGTGSVVLNSSELYDPSARTFIPHRDPETPRALHTATPLQDGNVLIAGGVRRYERSL